jgi:hypothetical protein
MTFYETKIVKIKKCQLLNEIGQIFFFKMSFHVGLLN